MNRNRAVFEALSRNDAMALLARHHVGRLAFSFHDRVDIEPLSYVYHNGWLYARTSEGTKLDAVRHHPWVAFEVDEIEGQFDWRSVVVRGTIYFLDSERGEQDRDEYADGLRRLRELDEDVLTDEDPAPHRQSLFRIHADEITGRRARSS